VPGKSCQAIDQHEEYVVGNAPSTFLISRFFSCLRSVGTSPTEAEGGAYAGKQAGTSLQPSPEGYG
jgi:hypothetical protein